MTIAPPGHDGWFRTAPALVLVAVSSTAAYAHPGDHSQFGWLGLAEHLFEPDHLIFIALIVLVGFATFRAGRRSERQRQARKQP
jgi:hydrogenase/urease accessory protein HupE